MKTPQQIQANRSTGLGRARRWVLPVVVSAALLSACSSSDDDNDGQVNAGVCGVDDAGPRVWMSSFASDYSSGRIDCLTADGMFADSLPGTTSDILVAADDDDVYQLGRSGLNSITKFDDDDLVVPVYDYSVQDSGMGEERTGGNPYSITFVSDNKAYITRYASNELWIVDPEADTEANFLLGTVDLSAYNDAAPNMNGAVLVGDKLFVLMERLNSGTPDKQGYVAVIDTTTDTEIDTGKGSADGLPGIPLVVQNPSDIQYISDLDEIMVVGRGYYYTSDEAIESHTGGLVTIDPSSYDVTQLLDDGSNAENNGYFYDVLVLNGTSGYLQTYESFGVTNITPFNPTTGIVADAPIAGLSGADVTTMALGPDGNVWLGVNNYSSDPANADATTTTGILIMNPTDNALAETVIATEFVPSGFAITD